MKLSLSVISLLVGLLIALGLTSRANSPDTRVILAPSVTTCGSAGSYRVSFAIGENGMSVGGGFKIRFVKGFAMPQISDPAVAGYVTARVSNPAATVTITQISEDDPAIGWPVDRNAWVLTAIVGSQALAQGDTIHVTYGANPPQGSMPGLASAFVDTLLVACDMQGVGKYQEISPGPALTILPGAPRWLAAYLPSRVAIGEAANLKIACFDAQRNLATFFAGDVKITSTDPQCEVPALVTFNVEDGGHRVVPIRFQSLGIHEVRVKALGTTWPEFVSNPVEVTAEIPQYRLYWGDLHSHSGFSPDGYGKEPFAAARDAAGLDFYALTEHGSYGIKKDSGLTSAEWEQVKHEVVRHHQPGQFVTLPALEFSAWPPSGHHNVYFNASDEVVPQLPLLREEDYKQIQTIWSQKESLLPPDVDLLTIPHHTGIIWGPVPGGGISHSAVSFGPGFSHEQLRPLIELYSLHGLSELYEPDNPLSYRSFHFEQKRDLLNGPHYAQDAWALGEYLGVIASSDDHTSQPGRDNMGVAAVYATELTRDAIFEALKSRRTYGTTGKRLLLHFDVNGSLMGSKVTIPSRQYPRLTVKVIGTQNLDFIEILRREDKSGVYANGHPVFTSFLKSVGNGRNFERHFVDSTYSGSSLYYVRVKQVACGTGGRPAWAWSSPIWAYPEADTNVNDRNRLPHRFELSPGYPNPFKGETSLRYYMPSAGRIKTIVYNTLGQQVEILLDEWQAEGWNDFKITRLDLSPGIYFVRVEAAGQIVTRKILLVK